jgi:hypothetical protein
VVIVDAKALNVRPVKDVPRTYIARVGGKIEEKSGENVGQGERGDDLPKDGRFMEYDDYSSGFIPNSDYLINERRQLAI